MSKYSKYLRDKIQEDSRWGNLTCIKREWAVHKLQDGAISSKQDEELFTIRCDCKREYQVWYEDLNPKQMDCGCGLWEKEQEILKRKQLRDRPYKRFGRPPIAGTCRVSKTYFIDPDILREIDAYGHEHNISNSEAVNRLLQLGLGEIWTRPA
jgi:hypothetical protein